MVTLKICGERKGQLIVSNQVIDPCCGLVVIFCGLIFHLIGCKTIKIPEIFSGVHGFRGKTVEAVKLAINLHQKLCTKNFEI